MSTAGIAKPSNQSIVAAWWRDWLPIVFAVVVTALVYIPAVSGGFLLDDDRLVTANNLIRDPNGWWRFWCTTTTPDYLPLMSDAFWVQWRLWGLNPAGYHIVNIVLHCANTALVAVVLRRLKVPGAWIAALLFGIHPVNVRSVAWISELKNTLSMVFFLSAVWSYLVYDEKGARKAYWTACLLFLCALLTKSSTIVYPAIVLLLVWYRRGGLSRSDFGNALPMFAMSAAAAASTIWYQYNRSIQPNMVPNDSAPWRLASAGYSVWFYLIKLFAPVHLAMIYPRWQIDAGSPLCYLPTLLVVACLLALYIKRHTRLRPLYVTFLYYLIALAPVLGFVNMAFFYSSMVSDHLQYIAMIGVCALVAAGVVTAHDKLKSNGKIVMTVVATACFACLAVESHNQAALYKDQYTLAVDTLNTNPDSFWALGEVATADIQKGDLDKAEKELIDVIRLAPAVPASYNDLGSVYYRQHRTRMALMLFQKADELSPNQPDILFNIAAAYIGLGDLPNAAGVLQKNVAAHPEDRRSVEELAAVERAMSARKAPPGAAGRKANAPSGE